MERGPNSYGGLSTWARSETRLVIVKIRGLMESSLATQLCSYGGSLSAQKHMRREAALGPVALTPQSFQRRPFLIDHA